MNLFSRMGWLPKYVVLPAIVILIGFFGWKYINKHTNLGGGSDLKIGLNAFSGAAGLPYINGGMITTKDSRMATEFKLNVEIKQIDIRNDAINALTNNNDDKEWVRENHHELSYNKFLLDYKNGVFNNLQFINNSNYLVSANAILNHRSSHSLSTVSELDAFIRVCDGIVPIRDIVKRPLLYYRDHNPNMSNKDIGINASNYIINNLKLNSYPEWTPKFAKDIMNKNRSLAKSIVIRYKDNPEGLYNKFI
jgi:hypothetical protein